jgi:hypothetical protein
MNVYTAVAAKVVLGAGLALGLAIAAPASPAPLAHAGHDV